MRVFASRAAKVAPPRPPPVERQQPSQDGATPSGGQAAGAAPERRFGRFARDANGNFARPEGTPVQPEGDRQQRPWGGDQPGGGRSFGAGDRPGVGRDGRPGGGFGGRGPGGGFRNGDRDAKGRKGRSDEQPQLFGKAATEARRNARASRKEERDAKSTKKERAEFVELPPRGLSVEELAEQLAVNSSEVIKALFMKGIMTTVNQVCNPLLLFAMLLSLSLTLLPSQVLNKDQVTLVATAFECEVLEEGDVGIDSLAKKTTTYVDEEDLEYLQPRAPVVTIMGHVDHGKTSLLDYIRKTRVAAGEAGGITQAMGAYQVNPTIGGVVTTITFLDTPGHEAFSAMRARGARVTDIAIIVVAADDGVRPQTLEAIQHAQAAGVPIICALNKIDKEGANVERVKQELATASLVPEEWGGTVPCVPISAKKGTGVEALLETILLVAELQELAANPERSAAGTVVEAYVDKQRGVTATLLVQTGTLRTGDVVVCGPAWGRVRALLSDAGQRVQEAGPSTPVQMLGLDCVPTAGDEFDVCDSDDEARVRAQEVRDRLLAERIVEQSSGQTQRVGTAAAEATDEGVKRLNIVLKTDVSGSLEAVKAATGNIVQEKVQLRFLLAAAGEVNASDIDLASASEALVLAFNLPVSEDVLNKAKQKDVDVRTYDVIYGLVDDVKAAMEALLKPVTERVPLGTAEVRGVFGSGAGGKVAGCLVTSGKLVTKCQITVTRGKEVVFTGRLDSLRRVKEVVKEVNNGTECGAGSEFSGWKEGDKIEAYDLVTKRIILPFKQDASAPAGDRTAVAA